MSGSPTATCSRCECACACACARARARARAREWSVAWRYPSVNTKMRARAHTHTDAPLASLHVPRSATHKRATIHPSTHAHRLPSETVGPGVHRSPRVSFRGTPALRRTERVQLQMMSRAPSRRVGRAGYHLYVVVRIDRRKGGPLRCVLRWPIGALSLFVPASRKWWLGCDSR